MEETFHSAERIDSFELDMAFHTAVAEASRDTALAEAFDAHLGHLPRDLDILMI